MQNINYSDDINQLPMSDYRPSGDEINIMNTLFKENDKDNINSVLDEFKDVMILGIFFLILASPILDKYINRFIPITKNSTYYSLAIKSILFVILAWFYQNKYLSSIKN